MLSFSVDLDPWDELANSNVGNESGIILRVEGLLGGEYDLNLGSDGKGAFVISGDSTGIYCAFGMNCEALSIKPDKLIHCLANLAAKDRKIGLDHIKGREDLKPLVETLAKSIRPAGEQQRQDAAGAQSDDGISVEELWHRMQAGQGWPFGPDTGRASSAYSSSGPAFGSGPHVDVGPWQELADTNVEVNAGVNLILTKPGAGADKEGSACTLRLGARGGNVTMSGRFFGATKNTVQEHEPAAMASQLQQMLANGYTVSLVPDGDSPGAGALADRLAGSLQRRTYG